MEKQHPQPPAYSQSTYSTPGDYGVQTAQPTGTNVPSPPPGYAGATNMPPPPPGYVGVATMPPPPPGTVVGVPPPGVVTTVVVGGVAQRRIFTKFPTAIVCQHCNATVTTAPRAEIGVTTWAIAGIMILVGFWLGCCLIPFCIDECKDIHHDCPNCHKTIDVYKHM